MEVLTLAGIVAAGAYLMTKGKIGQPSGSDPDPLSSPTSYPYEVQQFAKAIARAEGFYLVGSAPQRAHNPGALKVPGWQGPTAGSQGISVFSSDAEGWEALHRQLWLIVTGKSGVYDVNMTIGEMAQRWTTTQQSGWAVNVSAALGVNPSTQLYQVLT